MGSLILDFYRAIGTNVGREQLDASIRGNDANDAAGDVTRIFKTVMEVIIQARNTPETRHVMAVLVNGWRDRQRFRASFVSLSYRMSDGETEWQKWVESGHKKQLSP